jgi:hypothetical protein
MPDIPTRKKIKAKIIRFKVLLFSGKMLVGINNWKFPYQLIEFLSGFGKTSFFLLFKPSSKHNLYLKFNFPPQLV